MNLLEQGVRRSAFGVPRSAFRSLIAVLVPNRQDAYSALNAPVFTMGGEHRGQTILADLRISPRKLSYRGCVSNHPAEQERRTPNAERRTRNAERPTPPSMLEMTRPGENHRHLALIRRSNYRVVPNRTARLNDRGRPSFRRRN
jgi:hypothetical protein